MNRETLNFNPHGCEDGIEYFDRAVGKCSLCVELHCSRANSHMDWKICNYKCSGLLQLNNGCLIQHVVIYTVMASVLCKSYTTWEVLTIIGTPGLYNNMDNTCTHKSHMLIDTSIAQSLCNKGYYGIMKVHVPFYNMCLCIYLRFLVSVEYLYD